MLSSDDASPFYFYVTDYHFKASNIEEVHLNNKEYNKYTLSFICLYLFLIAAFSVCVLMHIDVRKGMSSLETKMWKSVVDKQNELRRTMHPQAYSLPDFALDVYGAYIVPHLTSKTYSNFQESMQSRANAPWLKFKTPSSVIRGQTLPLTPGHCWPLEGGSGQLFIALAHEIHITHVSLGHIGKEQSPVGQTLSAPKRFTVYGLKDTFEIHAHTDEIFQYVKLVVESNYGNPSFTCLYNFKVHGQIPQR
uniref:SUN domain-containing protein n=1 Tax=Neogobius melanostomus TaxID=47308 RepID=A0A8C6TLP4_9GOBI